MRRFLGLAALLASVAACDPCAAAMQVHANRCAGGDSESCEWIQQHGGNVEAPVCG